MGVKVEYQILHDHAFNHISIGMILFHDISSYNLHRSSLGLMFYCFSMKTWNQQ